MTTSPTSFVHSRAAVEARGDQFYLNLCFVDFTDQSPFHHTSDPEEYAEFMTYVVQYLDTAHNVQVDGLEIILEPDNADRWHQSLIPSMIAAVGDRLKGAGYDPEIIAPSVLNLRSVPAYLDKILENPKAIQYLDVLSYHRYSGNTDTAALLKIAELAEEHDLKTSMLEYDKNGDVGELHFDLKHVNNTAWQKFATSTKQMSSGRMSMLTIQRAMRHRQ